MRFLLATTLVLVGISVSGMAQQSKTYKVRPTDVDTAPKSTPSVKAPATTAGSTSATSKELRSAEHQSVKGSGSAHAGQRPARTVALKSEKDEHNAPMNFSGKSAGSGTGLTKQGNPYAGRLKQKGQGAHH